MIRLVDRYEITNISNDNESFTFYVDLYLSSITANTWPDLTVYMSNTTDVLCETGTAYLSREPEFTRDFLVGFVLLIILVLLLSYYVCFRVVMSPLWFPHTNDVRFVGGLMSYLCYLCLFAYSGAQHILRCVSRFVCLRLVYPMLPVSLDCPFSFL
jgi:hypothetical protein